MLNDPKTGVAKLTIDHTTGLPPYPNMSESMNSTLSALAWTAKLAAGLRGRELWHESTEAHGRSFIYNDGSLETVTNKRVKLC